MEKLPKGLTFSQWRLALNDIGAAQDGQAVMAQDRNIAAGKRDPKKSLDDDIEDPNVDWSENTTNNYYEQPQTSPQPKPNGAGKLLKSALLGAVLLGAGSLLGPLLLDLIRPPTPPITDFTDTDTQFFLDFGEVTDE